MNYFKLLLTSTGADVITDIASGTANSAEGLTGIAKALHDYGPLIVIFSVFILLFLGMALMILRSNSKLMDRVLNKNETSENLDQAVMQKFVEAALDKYTNSGNNSSNPNTAAIAKIESDKIVSQLNNELQKATKQLADDIHGINRHNNDSSKQNEEENDYHKDIVGAYIDVNIAFKDASRHCLNSINASRIGIYVFHNGNSSICGLPFFKFSCVHEWTSNGSGTIRGKYHTDIPLQYFNDFIEDLWKNGVYKTTNIDKAIKDDPSLEEFIVYSHINALYIIGVYDVNDKLAGFIIAEFDHEEDFDTNESRDRVISDSLKEMSGKISPIIGHHYIYRGRPKEV